MQSAAEKLEPEAAVVAIALGELVKAGGTIDDADTLSAPMLSIAISLKRIADALGNKSPSGDVLYWLEMIASAANAGRS